ncbi:ABC transporter ATP-binding protein [Cohaesibacter celericrescens]|uniref:ABC transporter ATP-binding protein n=1 Tax=Cohaesibacter celericrescens TaxID=2067669 RepID=UPI003568AB2F
MIRLDGVSKIYNQGQTNETFAVRDVSLTLPLDATIVFKGPSGSGKTSLLSMIGCLSRPSEGRIYLNGDILSGLPEHFMTEIRRAQFGFIFQRFNLLRGLSVLENVMIPAYPLGMDHSALTQRAMALLTQLQLQHKARVSTELLSGGEAQRVAIARALINSPSIVIADEPTANLDGALTEQFLAIMASLRAEGKTVILSSHDPRIWKSDGVNIIVSMQDGCVVDVGGKDTLSDYRCNDDQCGEEAT